jgi:hypothetical protein
MAVVTPEVDWDSGSTTTNSYVVYSTEEVPDLTTGTDTIASRAIDTVAINGKKIMMGVEVVSASVYSDVVADLTIQLSADGINWTANYATVIADTEPNVGGVKYGLVDFTAVEVPFFRLLFNDAGLDVGTTGNLKFRYIVPPS